MRLQTHPARRESRYASPRRTGERAILTSYFFGDSLTDAGSFKPALPPGTGMFTTNPGPVWAEVLAPRTTADGDSRQPGRQRLRPGRRPRDTASRRAGCRRRPATAMPMAVQVQQFLAKGAVDPHALYSVWGGANDMFVQLGAARRARSRRRRPGERRHGGGAVGRSRSASCMPPARATSWSSTFPTSAARRSGAAPARARRSPPCRAFQHHAHRRARLRLHHRLIRLNVFGAFERDRRQPGAIRLHQRHHAGLRRSHRWCARRRRWSLRTLLRLLSSPMPYIRRLRDMRLIAHYADSRHRGAAEDRPARRSAARRSSRRISARSTSGCGRALNAPRVGSKLET